MRKSSLLFGTAVLGIIINIGSVIADTPQRGGTLIELVMDSPRHLNPAVQSGISTAQPGTQLFASPLRYDDNWTPQPYLAKSWQISNDGLRITLHLVRGATFHDGVAIKSSDIAFSLKTVKENHPFKTMFAPVDRVETPDEHTAIIVLSRPHPALLLAMSPALLPIIPEHIYSDGQDIKSHPRNFKNVVGSGPFKFVEFKRNQHIVLEKNENYFIKGRPYLDKIVIRIVKDEASIVIALENGEAHIFPYMLNPRNIRRLKKNKKLEISAEGYAAIGPLTWLAFNTVKGKTADRRVRQAIAYAIDRNFINKAIMAGVSQEALTGIHPESQFYEANVKRYDLNIKKANKILDDAGFKKDAKGWRFSLDVHWYAELKPYAEYTKAQLKKIGIKAVIKTAPDFPTWAKRISNHNFNLTWDNVFNWGDPVIGVHRTYLSRNIKKGVIWSNTQSYSNKRVDKILEQAGQEMDNAKRKKLYSIFQKLVARDLPVYWTNAIPYHTVTNKKVANPPRGIWGALSPLDKVYLK